MRRRRVLIGCAREFTRRWRRCVRSNAPAEPKASDFAVIGVSLLRVLPLDRLQIERTNVVIIRERDFGAGDFHRLADVGHAPSRTCSAASAPQILNRPSPSVRMPTVAPFSSTQIFAQPHVPRRCRRPRPWICSRRCRRSRRYRSAARDRLMTGSWAPSSATKAHTDTTVRTPLRIRDLYAPATATCKGSALLNPGQFRARFAGSTCRERLVSHKPCGLT